MRKTWSRASRIFWPRFNNTQVAITDMQGNLIGWSSAGRVGFSVARVQHGVYAAQQVAQDAARQATVAHGHERRLEIRVKGRSGFWP